MDDKRAEEAGRLLASEVLAQAFKDLKDETVERWSSVPARDTEGREWLWMFYQNTLRFESVLRGYLATGKIDEFNKKQSKWFDKVTHMVKKG